MLQPRVVHLGHVNQRRSIDGKPVGNEVYSRSVGEETQMDLYAARTLFEQGNSAKSILDVHQIMARYIGLSEEDLSVELGEKEKNELRNSVWLGPNLMTKSTASSLTAKVDGTSNGDLPEKEQVPFGEYAAAMKASNRLELILRKNEVKSLLDELVQAREQTNRAGEALESTSQMTQN